MSPSRSNATVLPSGETSIDDQVAAVTSNAICRLSGRGVLMAAAGSFGLAGVGAGAAGFLWAAKTTNWSDAARPAAVATRRIRDMAKEYTGGHGAPGRVG